MRARLHRAASSAPYVQPSSLNFSALHPKFGMNRPVLSTRADLSHGALAPEAVGSNWGQAPFLRWLIANAAVPTISDRTRLRTADRLLIPTFSRRLKEPSSPCRIIGAKQIIP